MKCKLCCQFAGEISKEILGWHLWRSHWPQSICIEDRKKPGWTCVCGEEFQDLELLGQHVLYSGLDTHLIMSETHKALA